MVRTGTLVCAGAAVLCVLAGLAVGQPAGGAVVGLGLLLGALNPLVVQLLLRMGLNPGATSMTRLGVFTAVVIAAGFAVGVSRAWLLVLGVAGAQMVSAVTAAVEMTRR
jgi:hypothetical protein